MSVALSLRHATLCETQLNSIKIRVTTLNIVLVNGIYCIEVTFWFHFTCDLIWCWCLICSSRLGTGAALISTWSSFGFLSLTLSLTSAMIWIGLDLTNTSLSCPHHSTDRGWGQQKTIERVWTRDTQHPALSRSHLHLIDTTRVTGNKTDELSQINDSESDRDLNWCYMYKKSGFCFQRKLLFPIKVPFP